MIYSINDYAPAFGIESLIEHMQISVCNYRKQLIDVMPMENQDGTLASAKFRFKGRYFGDGRELCLELRHQGHAYDRPGYNFFVINEGEITEIKAFFSEDNLKKQISADEARLAEVF